MNCRVLVSRYESMLGYLKIKLLEDSTVSLRMIDTYKILFIRQHEQNKVCCITEGIVLFYIGNQNFAQLRKKISKLQPQNRVMNCSVLLLRYESKLGYLKIKVLDDSTVNLRVNDLYKILLISQHEQNKICCNTEGIILF